VRKADGFRTVFRRTLDTLGLAILRGDYGIGALPVEAELAASLGVGRNLLREAIKVLESKNLLAVGPKLGTRARPRSEWNLLDPDVLHWMSRGEATLDHAVDVVEFRLIVEPRAAHLAALRATHIERRAIVIAYVALEQCLRHPEFLAERDNAFHLAIHMASHNALLSTIGRRLSKSMGMQVHTSTDHSEDFEPLLPLHKEIAQAIAEGDAVWAEDASRRLILTQYTELADQLAMPVRGRLDSHLQEKTRWARNARRASGGP
jgi:GntR family galactonate operon transcriptional repressor